MPAAAWAWPDALVAAVVAVCLAVAFTRLAARTRRSGAGGPAVGAALVVVLVVAVLTHGETVARIVAVGIAVVGAGIVLWPPRAASRRRGPARDRLV